MSQLLSGSEEKEKATGHSFHFNVGDANEVGEVRRFAISLANSLGFESTQEGRVGIVINELGNNLGKYAQNGMLLIRVRREVSFPSIEIISTDSGPGFADVDIQMADGFTTGSTPGTGLGAVKRLSNVFDIYSKSGRGTTIVSISTLR